MQKEAVQKVPPAVIKDVRAIHKYKGKPTDTVLSVEERKGSGKATCRNCGESISEGEPTIYFHWAPEKSKPWMRTRGSIHLDDCGDTEKDWTNCPKCRQDVPNEEWRQHWMDHRYDKAASNTTANWVATPSSTTTGSSNYRIDFTQPVSYNTAGDSVESTLERVAKPVGPGHLPPERAMEIGEEEEETFWVPDYNPVQIPEEHPSEAPPEKTPSEPVREPEKVPAHTGFRRRAADDVIGASGEYLKKLPDIAHRTEQNQPVAYRGGLLTRDETSGEWHIQSPQQKMKWDRGTQIAKCETSGQHDTVPHTRSEGCNGHCGIYAMWRPDARELQHYTSDKSGVLTQVVGSGNLRLGHDGMRMQEATLTGIRRPACRYCATGKVGGPGGDQDSHWMSEAGWPACHAHREYWDEAIRQESEDPEMPVWGDMNTILKGVTSYYGGARVFDRNEPMKWHPVSEDSGLGINWDEELRDLGRGFKNSSIDSSPRMSYNAAAPIGSVDIHTTPEWKLMEIGPEEEETFWVPRYDPVQLPEDQPTEAPPEKTPSEPVKEPEKVPAHSGSTRIAMPDEAIGVSGGQYLKALPSHAHRTEQGQPVAYRVGNITKDDHTGEWFISSPMQNMKWERGVQVAHCGRAENRVPHKAGDSSGCGGSCGIYALWDEDHVTAQYKRESKSAILTQVVGSGNLRLGPDGLRMQRSAIVGLRNQGCHYCRKQGRGEKNADVISDAGWPACKSCAKEWDDNIRQSETQKTCSECGTDNDNYAAMLKPDYKGNTQCSKCSGGLVPEMPTWHDKKEVYGKLAGYYGADLYDTNKPMRHSPEYKEEDEEPLTNWDEELRKITGRFSSHSHFPSDERCADCPPTSDPWGNGWRTTGTEQKPPDDVPPGWKNSDG